MGMLRLFLALSVLVGHSTPLVLPRLLPGHIAVELFFIISGFYMSLVLDQKYRGRPLMFYANRFLRLWPTFILITISANLWWCALWLYFGHAPMSSGAENYLSTFWTAAIRFSNTFMIGQDIFSLFHVDVQGTHFTLGPSEALADGSIWLGNVRDIGQAWSIGSEIWFYLLAPALTALSSNWLISIMLISLLVRGYIGLYLGLEVYFFFPAQLALFVAGIMSYRVSRQMTEGGAKGAAIICAASVLCLTVYLGSGGDMRFVWFAYLLFAITLGGLFRGTAALTFDRTIGELSYPVYLSHMLIFGMLTAILKRFGAEPTSELLACIVLPLSYLLFRWVERPIESYRHSLSSNLR